MKFTSYNQALQYAKMETMRLCGRKHKVVKTRYMSIDKLMAYDDNVYVDCWTVVFA